MMGQFKKPIYIYMVSSSVDDCDIQRSKEYSGVTDYIIKPINKVKYQELIERLKYYNS
jgi:response regulator of citrate/malate metabolism